MAEQQQADSPTRFCRTADVSEGAFSARRLQELLRRPACVLLAIETHFFALQFRLPPLFYFYDVISGRSCAGNFEDL